MGTLYLCGAGNPEGVRLALTVQREQERWDRIALLDDDPVKHGTSVLGVEVVGPFELLGDAEAESGEVANLVARTTAGRWAARERIRSFGLPFAPLVHPDVDTTGAELCRDILVYQQAVVAPGVSIGDASVVFMGAIVGHESRVGRCCVIAANAVLNARVALADGVYVGTNATVLPELAVGEWATVGAGSVAVQDVPPGATVMGVPAETLVKGERDGAATFAAPRNELEESILRIWCRVLGTDRIGIRDNFFRLGGTSLSLMRITSEIQQAFHVQISFQACFKEPTVAGISREVQESILARADDAAMREEIEELGSGP
ncbi:MAG: phosphopantetheine-binding protein [Gemmatimonadota bacterium]